MADTHTMSNTAVYIDVPTHISIAIIPRECDGTPHLQIYLPDEKQLPCHLLRFCHWLVEDKLRTVVATIEKGEATESVMEDEEVFHHINKPDFLRDHNEGTFKGMGGGAVVDVGGLTDDGSLTPMRMWAFQSESVSTLPGNKTIFAFCVNTITKANLYEQRLFTLEHYVDEPFMLDAKDNPLKLDADKFPVGKYLRQGACFVGYIGALFDSMRVFE
ncbi:hypothetical protein MMC08_004549 [Hypocenomyce scalaris]|nr:hypothetical protein [Hypocenomyce scalaris]